MPQTQFPFFPEGVTHINALLAFENRAGTVTYFNAGMPVFTHGAKDVESFKMITAQFCVNGNTKQVEIARSFGVTEITVKRAVKLYREQGPKGFYAPRKTRGAVVLTVEVLKRAQGLLDEGEQVPEVAAQLGIKRNTLAKAVHAGRLHEQVKKKARACAAANPHQEPT
jgi:hypothetical protein